VNLGHWTYAASFYKKELILDHLVATYKKPTVSLLSCKYLLVTIFSIFVTYLGSLIEWFWNQVSLINGVVMGGGAGLSMPTRFRVVTEKAVSFSTTRFSS